MNPRAASTLHAEFGLEITFVVNGRQARGAVLRDLTAGKDLTLHRGTGTARVCAMTGWELREMQGAFAAFAADGQSLASVDGNRTILVWDAQAFQPPGLAPTTLTPADLEQAWKALAEQESARAHAALWQMTRDPEAALAFLQAKLKAPSVPAESRLRHLLRELDSSHFVNRIEAMRELEQYGELAEPTLRMAMAGAMPTERKRRLESLLVRIADDQRPERMQVRRGIEVLAKLHHPEARRVLEDLARGPALATITRAARAALSSSR
jgi:hypothetical protein